MEPAGPGAAGTGTVGKAWHLSVLSAPHLDTGVGRGPASRVVVGTFNVCKLLEQGGSARTLSHSLGPGLHVSVDGRVPVPLSLEKQKTQRTSLRTVP